MKTMRISFFILIILISFFSITRLSADGCYICTSGSTDICRDYCRYLGSDSFDNRKKCQDRGCKVGGTASCPSASNYKVCTAKGNLQNFDLLSFGRK
ncbi:hypothetical protein AB3N59_02020 [Leptospira sp. WS92.C1]